MKANWPKNIQHNPSLVSGRTGEKKVFSRISTVKINKPDFVLDFRRRNFNAVGSTFMFDEYLVVGKTFC